VTPHAAIIAFIRAHGTPKLKACSDDTLLRYLGQPGKVSVWVPNRALGFGWFLEEGGLYVANLMAVDGAALVALITEFRQRFPWITRLCGDRVASALRRTHPELPGRRHDYTLAHVERLARLAARRDRRQRPALRQTDLAEALGLPALPAPGRHTRPAGMESPAGGVGVLGLLSPLTA
jgi:hypothetical protein